MAEKRPATGKSTQTADVDKRRAFDLVMKLMAIPGKSCQEAKTAEFIVKQLKKAGVPDKAIQYDTAHRRTPDPGQCGNLIVKLPGTQRGPRRLLSAHLDTVPLCVGCKPVRRGKVVHSSDPRTALGADNRAGCAAILTAALEILRNQLPHPPLTFCWFVQEEIGLQGARCLSKGKLGNPKLAFNWDGGGPAKLTVGATGGYRIAIDIEGLAAHAGGAPEWGISAIAIASLAIADLTRSGWHGDIHKDGKHGTSNVGVIQGGEATNVVTDHVRVRAEARSHDPRFRKRIVSEIEKAFQRAVREVKNVAGKKGTVRIDGRLDYESFLLKNGEPCVQAAEAAVRTIGLTPQRAVANGGVDANWLFTHGIPSVSLGCGQRDQHTVSESLDVEDFQYACRIALCLATASEA